MMVIILLGIFIIEPLLGKDIETCPMITCSDEYATDEPGDDWCVRINWEEHEPRNSTVIIRECQGVTKFYCDWGLPKINEKMMWPFDQRVLSNFRKLNLFDGTRYEGKCLNTDQFFGRTQLYPGWDCLIDLDCHSKKCLKGIC